MKVSVVVPSYRRPRMLAACLDGLAAQQRRPNEIVVVYRAEDVETAKVARTHKVSAVTVHPRLPGYIAAMRAGVAFTTMDIVAFTDDDAVARPDWIARLESGLADDSAMGALGGRDHLAHDPIADQPRVGVYGPFGRLHGGHHKGIGPRREVDVLKGVNMAFRSEALALPEPGLLKGVGTEIHLEVAMCGWAKGRGWRICYDPTIVVEHEVGDRFGHQRKQPSSAATNAIAHNLLITTGASRGYLRQATWMMLLGRTGNPGLIRACVALVRHQPDQLRAFMPSMLGFAHGTIRGLAGAGSRMSSVHDLRAESTKYGERAT